MEKIKERTIRYFETRLTVYTGLFLCLGLIIPYITTHAYGLTGNVFLPMHIPVLLCGFFCGAKRGFVCGFLTPLLSSILTSMPVGYPMLPIMLIELSLYGTVSGFLFSKGFGIGLSLTLAMLAGKIGYAIMFYALFLNNQNLRLGPSPFIQSMPVVSALMIGIPGLIIQLFLIPIIVKNLYKNNKTQLSQANTKKEKNLYHQK